jgi:hypothetical protein
MNTSLVFRVMVLRPGLRGQHDEKEQCHDGRLR